MLFGSKKALIGVVHLLPLPGSPRYSGDMAEIISRAIGDARALEAGGSDALIVENYGDSPFRERVGPAAVAAMAAIASRVAREVDIPVGVNVLRNDCPAAVAVAEASGAKFIRCNAYVEVLASDQGILRPAAAEVQEFKRLLGSDVLVLADVMCKHATPLHGMNLEEVVRAALVRGKADGVVVTGSETGRPPEPEKVRRAKEAAGDRPVLVGSGVTLDNAVELLRWADGAIVGTWLKEGGVTENPVDPERVRALADVFSRLT
ncbi:MAG: BtpA/SgcQ family protein [Candidatus Korarchaeota archaeon]|nr:BtpA/SgcQ family protein [Candidatus Korarchaeota archaeon]